MAKVQTTVSDFEVLCTIGSGSYGTVKKVKRIKDNKIFVWKELDYSTASDADKNMLVSEVNLLRELKHENIVRYVDRIIDRKTSILHLVMEFCEGGDLACLIAKKRKEGNSIDESFIWQVCIQLASALKECHSRCKYGRSVLHRDLKPANIFLDSKFKIKLGDFGLARVLKHEGSFAKTCVGTPLYMSPEQMSGKEYNEKSDVWALGCLLYELCTLKPPFMATNQVELANKIKAGCFEKISNLYSIQLRCLVESLLNVKQDERPSIDVVLEKAKKIILMKVLSTKTQLVPRPSPSPTPQMDHAKSPTPILDHPKSPTPILDHIKSPTPQLVHPKSPTPQLDHQKSPRLPMDHHNPPACPNITTNIEAFKKENEKLRFELIQKDVELKKLKMKHSEVEVLCKELEERRCQLEAREQKICILEKFVQEKLWRIEKLKEETDRCQPPSILKTVHPSSDENSPWRRIASPSVVRPRIKQIDLPRKSKRVTFDLENIPPEVEEVKHDIHLCTSCNILHSSEERLPLKRLDKEERYGGCGLPRTGTPCGLKS